NHIGAMQIPAQFSFSDMKQLVQQSLAGRQRDNSGRFPDIRRLNLQAEIKLYSGDNVQQWAGVVTRVGDSIDPQGNTIALIVEMENDWRNFDPINNPPVMNDMFVEVNVKAKANQVLSVPTAAVHGESVYIVQDNVLKIKPVVVLFESGGFAAIDQTLANTIVANDVVIVTDLLPAIDGMMIRTFDEKEEQAQ
ncbi:MAG: hypothetical protein MJK04_34910, partial [Psychrosphaera sp.]|nr:hypothetical protein [Psychrosphaera sp.]